ncbi:MAG: PaaI family thioesterase [Alphaproteobacteria bacterium]
MPLPSPVMRVSELDDFLRAAFPMGDSEMMSRVEAVETGYLRVRQPYSEGQLRPGGTISGPVQMGLADTTMYLLTVAHIGPEPMAVTSSLVMNFLNRAEPKPLIAEGRLLKLGRSLAVGDIQIRAEGVEKLCAQATVTYSLVRTGK